MKKLLIYLLFLANFGVLMYSWWQFSGSLFHSGDFATTVLALGRLAGIIATYLILLQFILIGRVKWVETVFGLDKLSRVHRTNGLVVLGLIMLHVLLIITAHSQLNGNTYLGQYLEFITSWDELLKAFIGYCLLLVTIGLSITIVRKRLKYETWYYVHVFNYLALLLILGHQVTYGSSIQSDWFKYYWYALYIFALGNLLWFRFIRPTIRFQRHQFTVEKVVPEGPATSIYITGQHMDRFKIKAGQFMIFRFLQKGFWWQAHPFSMSMAPNGKQVRLTAKRLGDFTNELPNIKPGTKVLIDGPHGIFTEEKTHNNKLLFIAGGIGITPIRSMLEELGPKGKDMVLLYANKTKQEIVFEQELADLQKQHPFKIVHILSDEQLPGYEFGRLDGEVIKRLLPDTTSRDVYLCGPPPMMVALRKALVSIGIPKSRIYWERFAL